MRESLLTIPINEAFEPKCGCPVCNIRNTIEEHMLDYITGAAMMEPDVRIETNAQGFCGFHFEKLLKQGNRLPLALIVDTRLNTIRDEIFEKKTGLAYSHAAKTKAAAEIEKTCFVCGKVNWGVEHTVETVYTMFKSDEGFRKLYSEQEYLCVPHYNLLMGIAPQKLKKADLKAFEEATDRLIGNYLKTLNDDVHAFVQSFDYRNAGKLKAGDNEPVRQSVERAMEFLTSRKPDNI